MDKTVMDEAVWRRLQQNSGVWVKYLDLFLQVIGKKQLIRDIKLRFTMRIDSNIIVGSLIWGYVRMDAGFYLLVRA